MGILLDRLETKKILVADGAWGTMLQGMGLMGGACPEEWNLSHPEQVKSVAQAYQDAGADVVLTNTFGGSRIKLQKIGLADRTIEINDAGAKLSLAGAPEAIVAASIGPTGEFLEPMGDLTEDELRECFEEQITALIKGGVRALCIETMSSIEEACLAVKTAKQINPNVDVICTLTFDPSPNGFKTMMGVDCKKATQALTDAGADVIGSNCGNGIEQMIAITTEFRKYTQKPIIIKSNAGLPVLEHGITIFKQTPKEMSAKVSALVEAGANIIGGCCGTTPEHITAIKSQIDKLRSAH